MSTYLTCDGKLSADNHRLHKVSSEKKKGALKTYNTTDVKTETETNQRTYKSQRHLESMHTLESSTACLVPKEGVVVVKNSAVIK